MLALLRTRCLHGHCYSKLCHVKLMRCTAVWMHGPCPTR